ncbi:MAG: alpha/beta hydrolase [bacterium]|nr:alpha/beta hydrolase [bacterium]
MENICLSVNGLNINTLIAGQAESPPLVLLHGYPTSNQLWRRIIPGLADSFRIIAPDLPGHGLSDKPTDVDYDRELFVSFLAGLAEVCNLAKFDLVAHDLGAIVALSYAARFPERLGRLVVMDTAPYVEWNLATRLVIWLAKTPMTARLLLTRPLFRSFLQLGVAHPQVISADIAESYRQPWVADKAGRKAFSLTVAVPPEGITEPRENLSRVTVPTLVLWAAKDRLFGKRVAKQLRDDLPDATMVVVPDCGHFLQEEQPELIVDHLRSFLGGESSVDAPAA